MFIKFDQVSFSYFGKKNKYEKALDNINLEIKSGEFICITGHSGSGKSTLVQHINGLLKPTEGKVLIDNKEIIYKGKELQKLRKQIGLLYQFPEDQLFEETIEKDITFGPKKLGMPPEEIKKRLKETMELVGLDYTTLKDVSPMNISGGQKRRVALAGVLISKPSILILDEPTVGLDPRGRTEIMQILKQLHTEGKTIIMISHELDEIVEYITRLVVMSNGQVVIDGCPQQVLASKKFLEELKYTSTEPYYISKMLIEKGFELNENIVSWVQLEDELIKLYKRRES